MDESEMVFEPQEYYYKDMSDGLKLVIKELCKRVKAPYTKINFGVVGWQYMYTWSAKNSDEFKKWLIDFLYHAPAKIRRDVLAHNIKNKKYIADAVDWFMLDYSWGFDKETLRGVR